MHKSTIKKLLLGLIAVLCLYVLSGCSFSDLMSKSTGITSDPDYQTWEKLSEKGKLDQEGKYTADAVHITFAENGFFDMKYYKDPEKTQELPAEGCYLLPGDFLYCSVSVKASVESYYIFDHLDVIEYSDKNVRGKKLNWNSQDNNTAIMVPFEYKGTEVSIEPIGHYKTITVHLEQPSIGGHVIYTVDGQEIIGETAELYYGAKIIGILAEDTGWETQLSKQASYIVTDKNDQVVTFEGYRADDFFIESTGHRPTLKLDLNNNLKSCRTTVECTGGKIWKDLSPGGGSAINNEQIGTREGIKLTFSHFDLQDDNNAVRVTAWKKTANTEYKEIHYANQENNEVQINFESEVTYTSVSVLAEAVKVQQFIPMTGEGVEIKVQFAEQTLDNLDNKEIYKPLKAGSISTAERQIDVTITAKDGYKLEGPFLVNDYYWRRMRFDEYTRFVQEVLDKQVKKYCRVNLITKDDYGIVEYRVGDKTYSGESELLEGTNVVLVYTLHNQDYEIAEDRNIFDQVNILDASRFSRYEKTFRIERKDDGKSISREDKITVQKKVN